MAVVDQVMVFLCVLAPCSGQMFQCFNECSSSGDCICLDVYWSDMEEPFCWLHIQDHMK